LRSAADRTALPRDGSVVTEERSTGTHFTVTHADV
jgi:hypothetical protein